jgi:hypothetical protein
VSEIVIFAEMLEAGEDQLAECEEAGMSKRNTAILVYSAMEGVKEMMYAKPEGAVH